MLPDLDRPLSSPGFALLSVLLIVALVMVAVAGLLSVAATSASLVHSDEEGSRALGVADQGVARGLERLRWGWTVGESPLVGPAVGGGEYSIVSTEVAPGSPRWPALPRPGTAVPASTLRVYDLAVTGSSDQGRRAIHAVVVVTPDALPRGLVVGADASVSAPLRLLGCGLYAAGNVTGREFITLEPPDDASAQAGETLPDLAYGGIFESAAVHAGGVIVAAGREVHESDAIDHLDDDDLHTGGGPPSGITTSPDTLTLSALLAHSGDPGLALVAGRLGLDLLPPIALAADLPTCPATGMIFVIDQKDSSEPVVIDGDRGVVAGACPVTIVVLGNCQLGASPPAGEQSCFEGALVVTGRLTTVGATVVRGSVFAGSLDCRSSLSVDASDLASASWQESTPGSSNVAIVSWTD